LYDDEGRSLFFGTHFFNPPYSLPFLEFVETRWSDKRVADDFFSYLENTVLRKAIHVKDRAAFLGNRIGFIFMNEAAQFADLYKDRGGIDYMDSILGSFTGRAMAPLTTVDFVGIDTHQAIVEHLHACEPDFFGAECIVPDYVSRLVEDGRVGKKAGVGFFKQEYDEKGKKRSLVYDIASDSYRPYRTYDFPFADHMVSLLSDGLYQKAIDVLLSDDSEEAGICRYFLVKYIICSYRSAKEVSDNIADADIAMSYGFNWIPPSSLCMLFGGKKGLERLTEKDARIRESLKDFDLSLLDEPPIKTDIDYRRYFKASR
jgi:3-hydroxyacyl-CoA dehydrogenase